MSLSTKTNILLQEQFWTRPPNPRIYPCIYATCSEHAAAALCLPWNAVNYYLCYAMLYWCLSCCCELSLFTMLYKKQLPLTLVVLSLKSSIKRQCHCEDVVYWNKVLTSCFLQRYLSSTNRVTYSCCWSQLITINCPRKCYFSLSSLLLIAVWEEKYSNWSTYLVCTLLYIALDKSVCQMKLI